LYRFPKEKLIFGPMQMEARIDQDAEIAKTFALWSQAGTSTLRGHVLIIPISGSLLYIEPIYLRAEASAIPELRRVVVMFGEKIVMEQTFEEALKKLFGEAATPPTMPKESKTSTELIQSAVSHYNAAQSALKELNWTAYGLEIEQLGSTLAMLQQSA